MPSLIYSMMRQVKNRCLPQTSPSVASGRSGTEVVRAGERFLPSPAAALSGPFTLLGQHKKTCPDGVGVGDLAVPEDLKTGEPDTPLAPCCIGSTSRGNARELTLVLMRQNCWQPKQPCNHAAAEPWL